MSLFKLWFEIKFYLKEVHVREIFYKSKLEVRRLDSLLNCYEHNS